MTFLIALAVLVYLFYTLSRRGRQFEIRPLEGLEAISEGIGRCAEMGRPVVVLPGVSGLGSAETLAGLTILGEVAQKSAEVGVDPLCAASSAEAITAAEAIIRSSFTAAGKQDSYSVGKYVRWFGADQFSYTTGAVGQILADKPALIIHAGYFMFDLIPVCETGSRVGAVQVGGTGGTGGSMDVVAMYCDYIFIGEELYAAAARITRNASAIATLAAQDWMKLAVIALIVVGWVAGLAGQKIILTMIGS